MLIHLAIAATSLASSAADAPTIDATTVPVSSMTEVVRQPAPAAPDVCHPATDLGGDPDRYVVTFDIEADGTTSNVTTGSSGERADQCRYAVIRSVRDWTFEPPQHEGVSVRIEGAQTVIGLAPRQFEPRVYQRF